MNSILSEIKKIIEKNMDLYLPHIKNSALEDNGAVFYMNGRDGTEFDWYVNNKLPPFMVFYYDEKHMGAAKLMLYKDNTVMLCLYEDDGNKLLKEIHTRLESGEADLLELAVILRNEADDRGIWNADIEKLNTDIRAGDAKINQFLDNRKNYEEIRNILKIMNLKALVSKKIAEEGWKVGFMERYEPHNEMDSGWAFFAGDEDVSYNTDVNNILLADVGYVCQSFDPDIFKYVGMPIGTKLIRTSPDTFEVDTNEKRIFMVKR